ncbi:uncharacterized protein LOC34622971 [Cyclospora cayetanensis]|uniref:Uncharacterized protein LOC34622971 n=1 Tax=Cyclospora cayetanensis TaxID=88456 RepID=A0A6P6S092_9EIME|nr:uncharacterized protein LOC34622971 [Cyclospora cayetanensis]
MQHMLEDEESPQAIPSSVEKAADTSNSSSLPTQGGVALLEASASNPSAPQSETEDSSPAEEVLPQTISSSTPASQRGSLKKPVHHDADPDGGLMLLGAPRIRRRNSTQIDLPAVNVEASHEPEEAREETAVLGRRHPRDARPAVAKRARFAPTEGRATGGASSSDHQPYASRLRHAPLTRSGSEARATTQSAPAIVEPSKQADAMESGLAYDRSACCEGEAHQRTLTSPGISSPQMVKSVSPAGVVRIGGRNRRKRTKYDLAYKQMEELGTFEEEAKSVDLSKVSGSGFALELLRNPQQYAYGSWAYGFAWPVGADGRRLLLRKLRGVFWSNPEKWQRVLQEHNLYRRDLFTLATVQELFKVTHLMGEEAWDFLLKCTALTQKCDALTNKDLDLGEDDESGSLIPCGVAQRANQQSTLDRSKSEDESPSNTFFGSRLPSSGFVRKRMSCGGREEKDANKRCRGRPRKPSLKAQENSSEAEAPSDPCVARHTCPSTPTSDATSRWLPEADPSPYRDARSSLQSPLGGTADSPPCHVDEEGAADGGAELLEASLKEHRRLVASMIKATPPVPGDDTFCIPAEKASRSPTELRLALAGKQNNAMLKLTTHYAFMAQFMQCCMLVEVQRTLLKVAEDLKTAWPSDKERESPTKRAEGNMDPAARACFDSLVRSSNIHMQFVQLIVQQLQRHSADEPSASSSAEQQSNFNLSEHFSAIVQQLQLQRMRDHLIFAPADSATAVTSDVLGPLGGMPDIQAYQGYGGEAEAAKTAGKAHESCSMKTESVGDSTYLFDVPRVPSVDVPAGRSDNLANSFQALS